jgi:putative methyltransferase (TIGR04325 family)
MSHAKGYAHADISRKVHEATRAVALGHVAYEQDSVVFEQPSCPENIARVLALAAESTGIPLDVLDFGGSLGSHYFRMRPFLGGLEINSWTVCEQPDFVRLGREFEDGILRFVEEIPLSSRPHIVILSSVLPYLEDPVSVLHRITCHRPDWILIDRTPLSPDDEWHLHVQHVPSTIYRASYPMWLMPMAALSNALTGYGAMEHKVLDESACFGSTCVAYHASIWRAGSGESQ